MQTALIIFGWFFIVAMLAAIFVPWIMRKSDLLTCWNLFLIGSANFIGCDAIFSGRGLYHWGMFQSNTYIHFMVGVVVFYSVLFIFYYIPKYPRRLAQKKLSYSPPMTGTVLFFLAFISSCAALLAIFTPQVQFLGQISDTIGRSLGNIAMAVALVAWLRSPRNPVLFTMLCVTIGLDLIISILGTSSRRFLLSFLLTFPICFYWLYLRYWRVVSIAVPLVISLFILVIVLAGYRNIRGKNSSPHESSVALAMRTLQTLPGEILKLEGFDEMLGSGAVEASLVAISFYDRMAPNQPFHTLKYILANPIPRAWWPDKPEALGYTLPRDFGQWRRYGFVNWGPGIIGHGFYDGGYLALVIYGIVLGLVMRFFDELLRRQSDNAYLLGLLSTISGQVVAYSRGDIGLFSVLIIGAVVGFVILRSLARLAFGFTVYYPTDEERRSYEAAAVAEPHRGWAVPEYHPGGAL